jgi:aspartyl-tRNA(Asn)/glutamyl-tRNA(Gln) amidotransferase subunit C
MQAILYFPLHRKTVESRFNFITPPFMSSSPQSIDVSYLARLARLQLNAEEEALFTGQLERVLEHIAKIDRLDLSNIEPMAHAISVFDVVREDTVGESLPKEIVLQQAPHATNGLFIVPKVLE